jgi:tRNA-specific 2-thiouridylase
MQTFAPKRHYLSTKPLSSLSHNLVVEGNTKQTLLNLISLGDDWIESKKMKNLNINLLTESDGYHAVPGCMATVRLRVAPNLVTPNLVDITGIADSRVALGILAFLSQSLEGMITSDILALDPIQYSKDKKMDDLLPIGRLNGFQNILRTIQQAIGSMSTNNQNNEANNPSCKKDEVAVLLSGGVDSSVALRLLQEQGHKVRAYYLKIWLEDELAHLNQCPWEEDLAYAQSVCDQLHIPLETISLQKEYWQYVVQYTLREAEVGRTPNPDIMCNSRIKFGMFYQYIHKFHDQIATGHYAMIEKYQDSKIFNQLDHSAISTPISDLAILRKSPDPIKDQSYFLSYLTQAQLQRSIFPIGQYQKFKVRELANSFDLPTKLRKDSQGICFLGKLPFDEFIGHYMGERPGDIRDYLTGEYMGKHNGLWFHTINQRRGIGLLLGPGYVHNGPWFVASKDIEKNILYVTNNINNVDIPRRKFSIRDMNWIVAPPIGLQEGVTLDVKLRHGKTVIPGKVITTEGGYGSNIFVELSLRDKGIAPGQYAAFYLQDYCLGAGMIARTEDDPISFHAKRKRLQ